MTKPERFEPRLGHLTVREFLLRYWQREPLLIRAPALPGPIAFSDTHDFAVTRRTLFALARDPDVESRLVLAPEPIRAGGGSRSGAPVGHPPSGQWRLRHGPFARLPPLRRPGWTLLVQGVDLHLDEARALMDRFRFIPDARLDDLMVSFATDGGGVGPHVDSYDVFLLQVDGRRQWRVAPPGPSTLVAGAPLKILANFDPRYSWVLEPGDMLYLPPGWGHEGTAVGECMTCSIGFRSPSMTDLLHSFFGHLADQQPSDAALRTGQAQEARYRDDTREPAGHPGEIPDDMARTLGDWIRRYRPPKEVIERFIGCYLTEPKPSVWFEAQDSPLPGTSLPNASLPNSLLPDALLQDAAVTLDRKTRMLYRGRVFYINGEAVEPPAGDRQAHRLLRSLADGRRLDTRQAARALQHPWLGDTMRAWLAAGWLRFSRP
jgi:50S ribosomal protein L16 3-hydroxylase